MATAAPQLECRRTLPLTSLNTSATALVARLLADKATSYKVAERQHQRRRLPLHLRLEVQPRRRRPAYQARARSITLRDLASVCKRRRPESTISLRTVGLPARRYLRPPG